jgi:phosphoribosylanthranilate isomerase
MTNTRVKICGITSPHDAFLAAEAGADIIGLNFVGGPRQITDMSLASAIYWTLRDENAHPICRSVEIAVLCTIDPTVRAGAMSWSEVATHFKNRSFDAHQIYGNNAESIARFSLLARPWWKVVGISSRQSLSALAIEHAMTAHVPPAYLLDTASKSALGGTGHSFNWNWIAEARAAGELEGLPPIILAGGLTPENVADAIRIARPYAVDVSSGVEVAGKPGIKDPLKMRDFIQAAKGA